MKNILNQIHNLLVKRRKSVSVAESCTGGLTCDLLTQLPGSSKYFTLGIVAYSNRAKEAILKIPASLIAKKGAVSEEVAQRLAQSVKRLAKTDFGIGITGIAGPRGATPKKPVGTVFIAIDSKTKKVCKKFIFRGARLGIRKATALKTLELLKKTL